MARQNAYGIRQNQEAIPQGSQDLTSIAPGKIGPPDRSGEERIARKQQILLLEKETDAPRRMPRGMDHFAW